MALAQQTFESLKTAGLADVDPEIAELLGREADRLEHARPREILGGDQLDLPALAIGLAAEELCNLGVDVGETGCFQRFECLLGEGHGRDATPLSGGGGTAPRLRGRRPRGAHAAPCR